MAHRRESVFKFRSDHVEHMLHSVVFKIGLLKLLGRSVKHRLRCAESYVFKLLDHPVVDLIAELIKIDVLLTLLNVAVYIDGISGQHCGETDVESPLAYGERDLLRMQEDLSLLLLLVKTDG